MPLAAPDPSFEERPLRRALWAVLLTTLAVTLASYLLPDDYQSTGVALAFFGATYWLVLRGDETARIRRYGLSLGGLTELEPVAYRRLFRDTAGALGWALALALVCFPPFWLGYVWWWRPADPFSAPPLGTFGTDALGQVLAIALPEEAFYRGYLQTELDRAWRPRFNLLGAKVGPALVVTSIVFAVGHLVTQPHPNRLAVFFPSLAFGWLRSRTGGIGAAVAFHALCNLFSLYLQKSYGIGS